MKLLLNGFVAAPERRIALMLAVLVCFSIPPGDARAATSLLLNPDFDTDLSGWQTAGDVRQSTDCAVIIDEVLEAVKSAGLIR